MTMVVETGAIVAGANSLTSLAFAEKFFEDQGDTVWLGAGDDNQEFALIKALLYMRQQYRMRWQGSRVNPSQSADWPRKDVPVPDFFDPFVRNTFVPIAFEHTYFIPPDVIPVEVQQAQCLLARATMDATGKPVLPLSAPLGRVTKREKLGDLEVEYADGEAGQRLRTIYWDAQELLRPFVKPAGSSGTIVRS